jgi:hypothetical protein
MEHKPGITSLLARKLEANDKPLTPSAEAVRREILRRTFGPAFPVIVEANQRKN